MPNPVGKGPDIVFFTKGGMPTREEKDIAATLGGTVAFRDHAAASLEHDKAGKYIGYVPSAFRGEPGIIKDFNKPSEAEDVVLADTYKAKNKKEDSDNNR